MRSGGTRAVSEQLQSSFRAMLLPPSNEISDGKRLLVASVQFQCSFSAVLVQFQCSFRAVSEQFFVSTEGSALFLSSKKFLDIHNIFFFQFL